MSKHLVLILSWLMGSTAFAENSPRHAIELGIAAGPSLSLSFAASPGEAATQFGEAAVLRMALRTPYFLDPVLEVGFSPLFEESVTPGRGLIGRSNRLLAVPLLVGAEVEVGPVYAGFGLGGFFMQLESRVGLSNNESTELLLGYHARVGTSAQVVPKIRVGFELRSQIIAEASIVCFSAELSLMFEAFRW